MATGEVRWVAAAKLGMTGVLPGSRHYMARALGATLKGDGLGSVRAHQAGPDRKPHETCDIVDRETLHEL